MAVRLYRPQTQAIIETVLVYRVVVTETSARMAVQLYSPPTQAITETVLMYRVVAKETSVSLQ